MVSLSSTGLSWSFLRRFMIASSTWSTKLKQTKDTNDAGWRCYQVHGSIVSGCNRNSKASGLMWMEHKQAKLSRTELQINQQKPHRERDFCDLDRPGWMSITMATGPSIKSCGCMHVANSGIEGPCVRISLHNISHNGTG
jgi:hypothetical protein